MRYALVAPAKSSGATAASKIATLQKSIVSIGRDGFLEGVVVAGELAPPSTRIQMISRPLLRLTISSSVRMQMNISADSAYIVGSTPRRAAEYTTIARFWSVLEVK